MSPGAVRPPRPPLVTPLLVTYWFSASKELRQRRSQRQRRSRTLTQTSAAMPLYHAGGLLSPETRYAPPLLNLVVIWRSGSALVSINEVHLRRARLVPGWVTDRTCPGSIPGAGHLFRYVTSHPGQLSPPSMRGR